MEHTHQCKSCDRPYTHVHANRGDHDQFDFQCAYPDCDMYQEKGETRDKKNRLVKTAPSVVGTIQTNANSGSKQNNPVKDRLGKSIAVAHASGSITCTKREHWHMVKKQAEYTELAQQKSSKILKSMKPGVPASCDCEIHACEEAWNWNTIGLFQNQFVAPGNHFKGVGEFKNKTQRRVMPVCFDLSTEKLAVLHDRFPGWHFQSIKTGGHDHPISHVSNQVAAYHLNRHLKEGMWLDIFGNPAMCSAWNNDNKNKARLTSFVDIMSFKDVIRSRTKWAGHDYVNGNKQGLKFLTSEQDKINLEVYQGLVANHVLYYLDPVDIRDVLVKTDKKMLYATMHRFQGETGKHSDGEQIWDKTSDGKTIVVKQANKLTDEKYKHPCNEWWFKENHWYPEEKNDDPEALTGLCWTINMDCEDVFVFTITPAPEYLRPVNAEPTTLAAKLPDMNSDAYVKQYEHCILYNSKGEKIKVLPVKEECHTLFVKLRKKMPRRERTTAQLNTIFNIAKMSIKDDKNMDTRDFVDAVVAAYWIDMKDENDLKHFNNEMNLTYNKVEIGKAVAKDAFSLAASFIRNTKGVKGVAAATFDLASQRFK